MRYFTADAAIRRSAGHRLFQAEIKIKSLFVGSELVQM